MKNSLLKYQAIIDKELSLFFDKKIAAQQNDFLKKNYSHLKEFVLRPGKRIRPILSIMAFRAINDSDEAAMYPVSIASELFHTSSLIHDDIMDEDIIRRNKPTMHVLFENSLKQKDGKSKGSIFSSPKKRYGTSMAIMQGNLLFALAFDSILESDLQEHTKTQSLSLFNDAYKKTNEGQMLDVHLPFLEKPSIHEYNIMIDGKTVNPIIASMVFGALASDASKEQTAQLHGYAHHLGMGFQIHDDVLDLSEHKGRKAGSDLRKGNKTIVVVHALSNASMWQKRTLHKILGNPKATNEDIEKAIEVFQKTKSIHYAKDIAAKHIAKSKEIMEKSDFSAESKQFFIEFAQYIIERKQ